MRTFYSALPDKFYLNSKNVVAYLCRQQNFIPEERSQCPLICSSRWLNMMKVTTWFDKHRLTVVAYLKPRTPACKRDETWWMLYFSAREIARFTAIASKSLQRHNTLLCNQHHTLTRLVDKICSKASIFCLLSDFYRAAIDKSTHILSDLGKYAVAFSAVSGFMEILGSFVKDHLTAMNGMSRKSLLRLSAIALVGLAHDISEVFAKQTEDNQAYLNAALHILPHQLAKILLRNFS